MQAEISIPDDDHKIKQSLIRGVTAFTPNRLGFKPYWLNETRRHETADTFDVLVNVDGIMVGFNTLEMEIPEKEYPDCPASPGSWTAREAFMLHDMAPGVGYWAELSEWPWLEGYESEILAEIMEAE